MATVNSAIVPVFSESLMYKSAASSVHEKPLATLGKDVSRIKLDEDPYPLFPAGSTIFTQTIYVPSDDRPLSSVAGIPDPYPETLLHVALDVARA